MYITHTSIIIELNWPSAAFLLTQHMVSLSQITKTTFLWGKSFAEKQRVIQIQRGLIFTLNYIKSESKCKIRLDLGGLRESKVSPVICSQPLSRDSQ